MQMKQIHNKSTANRSSGVWAIAYRLVSVTTVAKNGEYSHLQSLQ